jgi:transposase-like protein
MAKFTEKQKLDAVLSYLSGKLSYRSVANQIGVDRMSVRKWVALYKEHGSEGLLNRGCTIYSKEFKLDVLEYLNTTGASLLETAASFNIPSPYTVSRWKKQLVEKKIDAPLNIRKGCLSMKKDTNIKQLNLTTEEALRAENERLRMENAYLKKLNALVQEKEKLLIKTKRK